MRDIWLGRILADDATATATALVTAEGESIAFGELRARVAGLAADLRRAAVEPGDRVLIELPRGPELLVALLATLVAGGTYVVVDPRYPLERRRLIAAEVEPRVRLAAPAGGALTLSSDRSSREGELPTLATDPEPIAYIAYTSGSGGRPKGVAVSRRSLARYIDWCGDALPRRGDGVPLFATASFDHAVTCLFPPLVAGEPIKLMPEFGEGEQLGEALLARGPYSFVKATPSHMRLLSADQRARLGTASAAILLGGEASDLALVASLRRDDPGLRILNHYGPTEATVGCLVFEVPLDHAAEAIPIGAPMPHVSVRVEDGELLIGGDCLASGYWRQGVGPVATGGFFADAAGLRWYRSGDLVGRTASGDLIHEGRLDRQVKHLGHRIELEEVESALRRVDTVEDACVVQLKDGGHLVAAVVPAAGLDEGEIKEEAAAGLISQAIPRQVVRVEALPTNVNGKCDFDAVASLFDPVAGPAEELSLADLWRDVLEVDGEIGPEDDFFELGGDSLAAVELVETIGARHGVELEISILFTASAFGDFEKAVHQLTAEGSRDVVG